MSGWTVIVPIRSWVSGKTRLGVDPAVRESLTRAMALDTVESVLACDAVDRVVVVTAADAVARDVVDLGAEVVADPEIPSADPLNVAITWAIVASTPTGPVAAQLGDVPALTPQALAEVLEVAGEHATAFVPDAEGSGTVLLTARSADLLVPSFGADSAAKHAAGGAMRLEDMPDCLRRDVDTFQDLREAQRHGVGVRTVAVLDASE